MRNNVRAIVWDYPKRAVPSAAGFPECYRSCFLLALHLILSLYLLNSRVVTTVKLCGCHSTRDAIEQASLPPHPHPSPAPAKTILCKNKKKKHWRGHCCGSTQATEASKQKDASTRPSRTSSSSLLQKELGEVYYCYSARTFFVGGHGVVCLVLFSSPPPPFLSNPPRACFHEFFFITVSLTEGGENDCVVRVDPSARTLPHSDLEKRLQRRSRARERTLPLSHCCCVVRTCVNRRLPEPLFSFSRFADRFRCHTHRGAVFVFDSRSRDQRRDAASLFEEGDSCPLHRSFSAKDSRRMWWLSVQCT